ncbi:unnamed protein product, partial [marine sediment metagenome]
EEDKKIIIQIKNEQKVIKSRTGIYSSSIQASLFVFPNGSYGTPGFEKYIVSKTQKIIKIVGAKAKSVFSLTSELRKAITGGNVKSSHEERLNNLRKYSKKYANTIETILSSKDDLCYVYCNLVVGSGLVVFSKILELFGFKKAEPGHVQSERPRYAILSSRTTTPNEMVQLTNDFNNDKNKYGKHIKVILGSRVISEGFSFKNIRQIHILTPFWNYTQTVQAIYRGLRAFSHNALGNDVTVKVYQH